MNKIKFKEWKKNKFNVFDCLKDLITLISDSVAFIMINKDALKESCQNELINFLKKFSLNSKQEILNSIDKFIEISNTFPNKKNILQDTFPIINKYLEDLEIAINEIENKEAKNSKSIVLEIFENILNNLNNIIIRKHVLNNFPKVEKNKEQQ